MSSVSPQQGHSCRVLHYSKNGESMSLILSLLLCILDVVAETPHVHVLLLIIYI